jgi:predicted RNase H-like HicB family nuclease
MRTVKVIYHSEQDGWWAELPDFPGYTAVGATRAEVREHVLEGIPDMVGEEGLEDLQFMEVVRNVVPILSSGNPLTQSFGFSFEVTERFQKPLADLSDSKKTGKLLAQ